MEHNRHQSVLLIRDDGVIVHSNPQLLKDPSFKAYVPPKERPIKVGTRSLPPINWDTITKDGIADYALKYFHADVDKRKSLQYMKFRLKDLFSLELEYQEELCKPQ